MNHLCMQIHLCQEEKYSQENSGGDSARPHLLGACCGKSESELPLPSFHNANTSLLSWSQVFKMSPPTLATYRCWAQPERKAILCSVGKEKWTQLEFWGMVCCYPAYLLQGFSLVILTIPDWELYSVTPGLHRSGLCVGAFQSWTASWNPNWVSEFEFLSRLIFELVLFTLYCLTHLVTYMCG